MRHKTIAKKGHCQAPANSPETNSSTRKTEQPHETPCGTCERRSFCSAFQILGKFDPYICSLSPAEKIQLIALTGVGDDGYSEHFKAAYEDRKVRLNSYRRKSRPVKSDTLRIQLDLVDARGNSSILN